MGTKKMLAMKKRKKPIVNDGAKDTKYFAVGQLKPQKIVVTTNSKYDFKA
jgi:hypothetical protein